MGVGVNLKTRVERKKYGLKKARRAPQWSKR
ncbi:MAG: 30S ribosomal protein S9 [Candidatus Liptonbacteria bacterium]|nr:30S ribosomal protein S9 [Candidatus Liptonbacteria bacterium]